MKVHELVHEHEPQLLQANRAYHHLERVWVSEVNVGAKSGIELVDGEADVDAARWSLIHEVDIVFVGEVDEGLEVEGVLEVDDCLFVEELRLLRI